MDLNETIHNCVKGNRAAQEQLYRHYAPMLYGVCLKYSKNKVEAEDNLHDSFMIIFNKIGQFKFNGSFDGWIKRVTVNTVLQKYRKETYVAIKEEEKIEDPVEVEVTDDSPSLSMLLSYIQELPYKYRTTFNLYVLDGYTHKEIGDLLGTTAGTSKSNLARARQILKSKIEKTKLKIVVSIVLFCWLQF